MELEVRITIKIKVVAMEAEFEERKELLVLSLIAWIQITYRLQALLRADVCVQGIHVNREDDYVWRDRQGSENIYKLIRILDIGEILDRQGIKKEVDKLCYRVQLTSTVRNI